MKNWALKFDYVGGVFTTMFAIKNIEKNQVKRYGKNKDSSVLKTTPKRKRGDEWLITQLIRWMRDG